MSVNFGRDTSCGTSLRTGRFSTGARLIGENAAHRLSTPRGKLRGAEPEQNYGLDLSGLVGKSSPDQVAANLPGQIRLELTKDERMTSVNTVVTTTKVGPLTKFLLTIDVETSDGPFTLKLAVDALTVEVLDISEGT